MSSILPIHVGNLVHGRPIESARVEFKASWHPDTTGLQVLKTVCTFANDLQHLNGGYVVIGIAESEGRAVLPPVGLSGAQEWRTGLPRIYRSMEENGSPPPYFDFDENRSWFRATLPAHPEYAAVSALQFEQAGDAIRTDSRALHEFAQTKMRLAQDARRQRRRAWREVDRRLLMEARG